MNSSFNDVFGFFVSGGFDPATWTPFVNRNIAIIPGTVNTPVSINNVNNGTAHAGPCVNCAYYINNTGGAFIEYDGFTTVLTASLNVVPCVPYSIKIAIADTGDGILDSGVFLEANSFTSDNVQLAYHSTNPINDSIAIEGCDTAIVTFKLPSVTPVDKTIHYSIGGSAVNGVDYQQIPNNVVVPAGSDSVNLYIIPIMDSIPQGVRSIRIIANTSFCTTDTIWAFIDDYHPMEHITSNDTVLCEDPTTLYSTGHLGSFTIYMELEYR